MSIIHLSVVASDEPSPADLAAIEAEWPLIAAELDLLDAEIREINTEPTASVLDRRRVRRAERRVLATRRELAAQDSESEVVA
ncbi:DUF6284 family protein [Kribbella sp. NPDC051770]|uniref:DUF6284 family protein n=1 Tax=Kribbella sp. NPDC051770 TaxID=3155413 RepID=UPI0034292A45